MDPVDRIGALTFTKSELGDLGDGDLPRFKQSAFRKGGESRLLTGFARKRIGLGSALGTGHGVPPFVVCFRSMTRSSSNPWRRRSSLDDAATRLSAWTGLIRNGKRLGLSIRSFSGAEPLARALRDASASHAISRESSTASVAPAE